MTEILLDSSTLIDLFQSELTKHAKEYLFEHRIAISIVSHFEVVKFCYKTGRTREIEPIVDRLNRYPTKFLSPKICRQAAQLAQSHNLSTADALIYATALDAGTKLATSDTDLKGKPGVVFLAPKTGS